VVDDANAGDFVLSNDIVSMSMAMLAEDYVLHGVLKELLWTADGNELYIRPVAQYLAKGRAWQILPATSSTRTLCPRLESNGTVCRGRQYLQCPLLRIFLPVIQRILNPRLFS